MLRRILQRTPGKGGPDQPATDVNIDQTSEGFICPQCMKSHNSAEELFKHYEVFHECANEPMSQGPSREVLVLLRQEVQDLQASLKEEKWFSGELKKELDKVQGQLKQGPQIDGRAGVEESELERKLNEAETDKFDIKQMKDLFEQKAAQLATEVADIKSCYDEKKSLLEIAGQQISILTQDLQKEKQEKECYQAELLKENVSTSLDLQQQLDMALQSYQEVQAQHQSTSSKLREAQNDLEQVLRQIGDKDQRIQNLEALLQKSRDSISHLEAERGELCAKIEAGEGEIALFNQLQEENHALQEQLKVKTELLLSTEAKTNQVVDLQNHLETAQLTLQEQQQELEELHGKLQEKQGLCAQLEISLMEYKGKLLTWGQGSEKLEGQIKKLEAEVQEVQTTQDLAQQESLDPQKYSTETDSKMHELTRQLCTEKEGLQKDPKKESTHLMDIQKQLQQQVKDKAYLQQRLDSMANNGLVQQEDLEKVWQEKEVLTQELKIVQEDLKKSHIQLDEEKKRSKAILEEMKVIQQAKQQLHKMSEVSGKELAEVKGQVQKMEEAEKGLESQLTALTAHLAQTQDMLKEREEEIQQLQEKMRAAQGSFTLEVKRLEGQLTSLQSVNAKKVEEEGKLREHLTAVFKDLTSEKAKCAELQKSLDHTQQTLAALQSDCYAKDSEISALRHDLKASEDKLTLALEELLANQTQMSSQAVLIHDLKASHTVLMKDITKNEERLRQQEEDLRDMQQRQERSQIQLQKEHLRTMELKEEKSRLEQAMNCRIDELKANTEHSNKELTKLQEAKELLIQQKLEMQRCVECSQAALEQERREHQAIQDSLNHQDEELKKEKAYIEARLETELKAKAEFVRCHEEAKSRLSMQVMELNENMAALKREWLSSQRRVGELEKQTDELRGEIAVLEATVQNNLDERRALLERCIKGEGEMETLQAKVVEVRHKLDDTTAAMLELGRENQSLQIKHSQNLTRKWAEDHEVQNCMSCGKGFSMTVRKHHCRHCGNIFCGECSSKNALTPSSKKPVRVCDTCFEELQS